MKPVDYIYFIVLLLLFVCIKLNYEDIRTLYAITEDNHNKIQSLTHEIEKINDDLIRIEDKADDLDSRLSELE